ncbi:hypothetical protein BXZ70DRAFT_960024 [Cristinia sonorae]|uniref:F-box domain-containing protein n=1 Tax=Cristinia sonorae TaxID=1940300 RepID=A0A8K0XK89_9AGAR|nr:hypothetical protein BXZ70DRAFT_960024 [Cristinia sonorae]
MSNTRKGDGSPLKALFSRLSLRNTSAKKRPQSLIALYPTELLVEIFFYLVSVSYQTFLTDVRSIDAGFLRQAHVSRRWRVWMLQATHVCRHWRAVAYQHPLLWTLVNLDWPRAWLQLAFTQSHNLPLHLVSSKMHDGHAHVNYLGILLPRAATVELRMARQTNLTYGALNLPVLRYLKITQEEKDWPVPFVSYQSNLQVLEHLELLGCPWREAARYFRPTLRYLSIQLCQNIPSVLAVLDALESMPLLEHLSVGFPIYGEAETELEGTGTCSPRRAVTLRNLTQLWLSGKVTMITETLQHLRYPASACVALVPDALDSQPWRLQNLRVNSLYATIAGKLQGKGVIGTPERLQSLVVRAPSLDNPLTPQFVLETESQVQVRYSGKALPSEHPWPILTLAMQDVHIEDLVTGMVGALGDDQCREVREVVLKGGFPEYLAPMFVDAFVRLPNVESLLLYDSTMWDSRYVAVGVPAPDQTLFPRMRELRLRRFAFHDAWDVELAELRLPFENMMALLLDLLASRREGGFAMDRLKIERSVDFTEKDKRALAKYVKEVVVLAL